MRTKYTSGDIIQSKHNLLLEVQSSTVVPVGNQGRKITQFHTVCKRCGYVFVPLQCGDLEKRKSCLGCEGKPEAPAALKTDSSGNCVTICRMGQLEYIHRLINEEDMTQQGAVESFIEAVQAHSSDGDPITSELTVEMVRSQYRRDSGKLKEKPNKHLVEPTQETTVPSSVKPPIAPKVKEEKKYTCLPTVVGVQTFLNEHLPGFKIVPDASSLPNPNGGL